MRERGAFGKLARGFAVASVLGTGFAAAAGLGVWLGYRCDLAFGWRPFGTIGLGLVGGIVGMVFILRTLAAIERQGRQGESGNERDKR
jgi:F0F1-type ATP synthase assembly protein I